MHIKTTNLVHSGVWLLAILSWALILLSPVHWPVSSIPARSSLMSIGPVSSFIVPGQTFTPPNEVSAIDLLIHVGGPYGSSSSIGMVVYNDASRTVPLAHSLASTISKPEGLTVTRFELDNPLPAGSQAYFELEISPDNPWPILVGGTREDHQRMGGQLYLRGKPGWSDQDLAYQLFRNEHALQRLMELWFERPDIALSIILSIIASLGISTGASLVVLRRSGWTLISGLSVALPGVALLILFIWLFS